ncbi:HAD family hydrolase [Halorarum halophilum]|uniref:HAD family hydrolase n=1 Tax=Halorarum halophilum TaxID=2743090 RepID=A0A7D5KY80_9EURY|nr:HAD family hydrolase [Halobaculum halophilum]QLG29498.1 HAD family hydrolase [Halobaculum halophilum]
MDPPVAVCFDMDGVLVDSEDYWHPAERDRIFPAVLAGELPDLDEVTGMNYREIYDYLDDEYEVTVSEAEFVELYDETATEVYGERVRLLPGAREFVDDLRDAGVPVALVSSSPLHWLDIVLDRFDLEFDLVASADEFDGLGKPEPGVYEDAIDDLGTVPEHTVVIEDSRNGVLAAHRAGARVIAYRDEHNADTDLSEADEVVEGPEELFAAVRQSIETVRASASGSSGSSG